MENPSSSYQYQKPSLNKFYPESILKLNNFEELYQKISQSISGPSFRNPIKNFIDQNCSSFIDISENSIEQHRLFQELNQMLENLLQKVLFKLQITNEDFIKAAEIGVKDPKYKKYYNQIINFGDYNFFKTIMIRRNYQLIKMAEQQMKEEQDQINKAIKQSLEEEKKKKDNEHYGGSANLKNELKSGEPQKKEEPKEINQKEHNLFFPKEIQNIINSNPYNNENPNQKNESNPQSNSDSSFNLLKENQNSENELINELQQLVINNLNKGDNNDNNDFIFGEDILFPKIGIPEDFNGKIPNYTYQKQEELRKFRDRVVKKKINGREEKDEEQNK